MSLRCQQLFRHQQKCILKYTHSLRLKHLKHQIKHTHNHTFAHKTKVFPFSSCSRAQSAAVRFCLTVFSAPFGIRENKNPKSNSRRKMMLQNRTCNNVQQCFKPLTAMAPRNVLSQERSIPDHEVLAQYCCLLASYLLRLWGNFLHSWQEDFGATAKQGFIRHDSKSSNKVFHSGSVLSYTAQKGVSVALLVLIINPFVS